MSKNTKNRNSFWKNLPWFWVGVIIGIVVIIGGWKITFNLVNEETQNKMLAFEENVKSTWNEFFEDVKNFFYGQKEAISPKEEITFEGAKLSEVANLNMINYIDFTIPYTWTFGSIQVDDPATEEAIAITGDNVVMSISLRNIEMSSEPEYLKWTEEATLFELENSYPDYQFAKCDMFDDKAAIVEGSTEARDAKLYVVLFSAGDKSIFVTYSFLTEDWNAELYFTTAISEMLEK